MHFACYYYGVVMLACYDSPSSCFGVLELLFVAINLPVYCRVGVLHFACMLFDIYADLDV